MRGHGSLGAGLSMPYLDLSLTRPFFAYRFCKLQPNPRYVPYIRTSPPDVAQLGRTATEWRKLLGSIRNSKILRIDNELVKEIFCVLQMEDAPFRAVTRAAGVHTFSG